MVLKIMSIIFPDLGDSINFLQLEKKNLIYCKILSQLDCLMIGISVKCEFVCTVAAKYLASPRYSKLKVSLSKLEVWTQGNSHTSISWRPCKFWYGILPCFDNDIDHGRGRHELLAWFAHHISTMRMSSLPKTSILFLCIYLFFFFI